MRRKKLEKPFDNENRNLSVNQQYDEYEQRMPSLGFNTVAQHIGSAETSAAQTSRSHAY